MIVLPSPLTLKNLKHAAAGCRACELWKRGTQTVFGEGPENAQVMLVGEQPGNVEDLQGRPFVGPAGKLLDHCLLKAGLKREDCYLTNVVKHFNWSGAEKWRIHKKPNSPHLEACRPWLDAELALIKPKVLVCLGATAVQALLGSSFKVSQQRGQWFPSPLAPKVMATVHPSSLLRIPNPADRPAAEQRFIADLKMVRRVLNR